MRRALAAAALVLVFATPALADNKTELDVSDIRKTLIVLHDGAGHYLAIEPIDVRGGKMFYGDGKRFYLQRGKNASRQKKAKKYQRRIWSPNSPHGAELFMTGNKWEVTCESYKKPRTPLVRLNAAGTAKLLKKAKFYPRLWHRSIRLLARDDEANYYLVDSEPRRQERLGYTTTLTDVRLFVGPAGDMKKKSIKKLASDRAGLVVVSKAGTMLIDYDEKARKDRAHWKPLQKKRKVKKDAATKIELRVLDHVYEAHTIFSTLGVYPARLGTPCDDLYVN